MSHDIFLQRFVDREPATADAAAIMAILEPLIVERTDSWARIETGDGEADVYGLDHPEVSLMVNHASGRAVWDVLFAMARAGGTAVMPIGSYTCVTTAHDAGALPVGAPPARLVTSGADILAILQE